MINVSATAPAVSPPAQVEAAFANTIVSTYPDGRQAKLWLNPDGTYRPIPIPFSWCTARVQGGVGATWTARAVTGEPIKVELKGGR